MIKYKTMSDNIYNSIAVLFALLSFFLLIFYQLYLMFNRAIGVNMLYYAFVIFEAICLSIGSFFAFKQLVRNRHIESLTAAIILIFSLFCFVIINAWI